MERTGPMVLTAFLCVALLAASCSGDDGGEDAEPAASTTTVATTTTAVPGAGTTTVPPADVGLDDLLGTQAVQDFAVHLGMWVRDDGGDLVAFYDSVLDEVGDRATEPVPLEGGVAFAPVDGLAARMVDADGSELPSLSVDFGLLGPTAADDAALDEELDDALEGSDAELFREAGTGGIEATRPLLVEIVSAAYEEARTHAAVGDRSEIDVTFVDAVEPGDRVAVAYLFGQTLPGDPTVEVGLSPTELFAYRWDAGLVQVLGSEGTVQPLVDTEVETREGSTLLTRDQKKELAQFAAVGAAMGNTAGGPASEVLDELWLSEQEFDDGSAFASAEMPLPLTDEAATVQYHAPPEGSDPVEPLYSVYAGGRLLFSTSDKSQMKSFLKLLRVFTACAVTASRLQAQNEAGRTVARPFDRFPTSRPLEPAIPTTEPLLSDDEIPEDPDPPEEPPLGCEPPPEDLPFPPFPKGGMAYGDVRISTIDGTFYNNNAAGEFLLYEDAAATVQMRLEPWATGRLGVSVATAAAIDLDGHAVSLHLDGSAWIDGEPAEFVRGETRSIGAGEITWWSNGWVIVAPDGTLIRVDENVFSFVIRVNPAAGAAPAGLLGDGDGDSGNDLVLRDGTPFDGDPKRDFERLYTEYIESWRITADESLFHYRAGESTESLTIDGFPTDRAVIDDLTGEERSFGEDACAAAGIVVEGDLLDACIVDVGLTGEPAFALDSFDAQLLAFERMLADSGAEPDAPTAVPGDTLLTIDGETLVFGTDPPNQRPQGIQASWSCQIIDGDLFADGSIDLADGPRYSITVRYLASDSRLTLLLETPNEEGLTRNYAWVETSAPHFADAIDTMTLDGQRFTVSGELYVNEALERGAPGSVLPDGATFDPFTLDLDCVS